MCRFGVATTVATAIGIGISLTPPAHAGDASAIGAGLIGFGIGAILGSVLTPPEVYYLPPPPPDYYYDPADYGPPPPPPKQRNRSQTHPHAATGQGQMLPVAPTKAAKTTFMPIPAPNEDKFMAAQEKAKRKGVQNLTQNDIDGLSYEQIKQLRGY